MRLVEEVRAIWRRAQNSHASFDLDAVLDKIKARSAPIARPPAPVHAHFAGPRRGWIGRHRMGRALAASIIVAAAGASWFASRGHPERTSRTPTTLTISTLRAERARVRLPDGSEVVLGPLSTLRYASDYGVARRELSLRGKALFTVRHDSLHPFTVRTDHMTVSDIGTRFLVSEYPEARAEVAVSEGSVAIASVRASPKADSIASADSGSAIRSAVLQAGDVASVAGDGVVHVDHGSPVSQYLSWTEGRLVFRNTPLREALAELSRWYDADLHLSADAAARVGTAHLTATIQDESLKQVTDLLRATFDLSVSLETVGGRKQVIFAPRSAPHR